jgi:serine protease Do
VLGAIAGLTTVGVRGEEIILKGGVRMRAPIVTRNARMLVLDFGYDLVRVPADEVLEIRAAEGKESEGGDSRKHLYTVRALEHVSTAVSAKRYSPAVVLVRTAAGQGSGFFVSADGYLLTNFHVVEGEKRVSVTQFVEEAGAMKRVVYKDVDIVATAPFYDLAVLRVAKLEKPVDPVVFAGNDEVAVGETVFTIGNPLGLERSVTEGVVSQTGRLFQGLLFLQVDAPVNPGNSGGPLFNSRGQIIGVVNMGMPWMQGLNFAIPAIHAKYVLDNLQAFAYDPAKSTSGIVYPPPPRNPQRVKADTATHTTNSISAHR